jgi:integrase
MTLGMGRPKSTWHDLPPRMKGRRLASGKVLYYYQAAGKQIALGSNLPAAKEEWARLEANGPRVLFPHIAAQYRAATFSGFSASTKAHYEHALRNLEVYFRRYVLEQIQPRHIKHYLRKRSRKGAALFEKRVGSALFNWARGEGLTNAPNPFLGIRFSRAEKRTYEPMGRRKVYVTEAMFQAVYALGDDVLKDAMDLGYLTGQRPSDLLKARRADIVDGVWWIDQQKTGKRIGIAVTGALAAVLERILKRPRKVQSVHIIADRRGQRVLYNALNRRFCAARGDADWQFRDIRARTASDALDLKRAQELLGHESEQTTATVYRRARGSVVAPLEPKKTA